MWIHRFGLGLVFLSSAVCPACGPPELPPQWQLEEGCHVWFDDGSGHGFSASSGGGTSTIEAGDRSFDGPEFAGADIVFQDVRFAHYDAESATLSIESTDLFTGECTAQMDPTSTVIHLEGSRSVDLQRSNRCTLRSAALGTAALYLAFHDAERHARTAATSVSHRRR